MAIENRQKITFTSDIPVCIANRVTVVNDPKQQAEITISSVARNIDWRLKVTREFTLSRETSFSLASCPGADHLVRGQLHWCRQLAPEVAFTLTSSTFTEMPAFDRNSIDQGSEDPAKDLGFGSEVARGSHKRLLNRDGTFNVTRFGLHPFSSLSIYHWSLSTSWPRFLGMLAVAYLCINTLFAIGYILCGINALQGEFVTTPIDIFMRSFFFSVQTFATIGYGHVIAVGTVANLLVTLEAFLNIVGVALATGVVFARFSRPTAKIIYSHNAVVAPYRGIMALEFRIANSRSSQIIELEAKVILSRIEASAEGLVRKFRDLKLERTSVTFFPLSWTLVHPIDEQSPIMGMNHEDLLESNAEILILLTGTDETSSQTVHSRSSYKADEIVWNAAFSPIFKRGRDDGILGMDVGMIHDYVKTGMGTETVQVFTRKPSN